MKIKVIISLSLILSQLCAYPLYAAPGAKKTPESLRDAAMSDVNLAVRLVKQAQGMLTVKATKEKIEAAGGLYAQAGQLFENSINVFKSLGPEYVPVEYVDKCIDSKKQCIDTLTKIKVLLRRSPKPNLPNPANKAKPSPAN